MKTSMPLIITNIERDIWCPGNWDFLLNGERCFYSNPYGNPEKKMTYITAYTPEYRQLFRSDKFIPMPFFWKANHIRKLLKLSLLQ